MEILSNRTDDGSIPHDLFVYWCNCGLDSEDSDEP